MTKISSTLLGDRSTYLLLRVVWNICSSTAMQGN